MRFVRSAPLYGLVLACLASGIAGAAVTNPGFEADDEVFFFSSGRFPIGWGGEPGGFGLKAKTSADFGNSEGRYAAQLFVASSGAMPGADAYPVRLTQSVDLSGIDYLFFDAQLQPELGWNPLVVVDFRVGGAVVWSQTSGGFYHDQAIDVSAQSGVHEIEFRLSTSDTGAATSGHSFFIDDLREALPPPRLTGARVEPHVIRAGIDTFRVEVTCSDPGVSEIDIDLGTRLSRGGGPAGITPFRDDGSNGDVSAGDGIFSAAGIGVATAPALLGIEVLRTVDVDYHFPVDPTIESVEDLALGFRSMDPSVPVPTVTDHASDVRASSHAVSIEAQLLGIFPVHTVDTGAIAQRYYDFFPDDLDFLLFSHDYGSNVAAGSFGLVRNDIVGTGQPLVDHSADFGSAGVLRGRASVYFGNAADFDLWNHELLHYWASHLDPALELGSGHWQVITGASSGFGSAYAYDRLELVSGNDYRAIDYPDAPLGAFSELELYLMGLLPDSGVPSPIETLVNPAFQGVGADVCDPSCGASHLFSADGIASRTMADIQTAEGVRQPAYPSAPQSFRGRLVVVFDRVLGDVELAYYDTAMREYEKASSAQGLSFAAATGGRADLFLPEPGRLAGLGAALLALLGLGRWRARAPRAASKADCLAKA